MEFPLGIFAIAIGMASLPSLSGLASQGKMEELKETLSFTFRLVSFISIPAMVGLIALKTPIINLLFQRGLFDSGHGDDGSGPPVAIRWASGPLPGQGRSSPAFYSLQDTWTPLKIALICLGANVGSEFHPHFPFETCGVGPGHEPFIRIELPPLTRMLSPKLGGFDSGGVSSPFCESSPAACRWAS